MGEAMTKASGDFLAPSNYSEAKEIAMMFSKSEIVPAHLRGKPADCLIVMGYAQQLGIPAMLAMQNLIVVHGTPGFKATFAIALANQRGPFRGPIKFRESGAGDAFEVTAFANVRETGEEVSFSASMRMAKAEGWSKNSKYQSMPSVMLGYRAATFLIRRYCPEVLCGLATIEEVEDIHPRLRQVITASVSDGTAVGALNASIESPAYDAETGEVDAPTDAELAAAERE